MFAFHKPKVFRSISGCCICRAKSSSSRFTDSKKYESVFQTCFNLEEKRFGEICNACVLLVKRYLKLPAGSTRHWNHVVDARSGPGIKSLSKARASRLKQKAKESNQLNKESVLDTKSVLTSIVKKQRFSSSRKSTLDIRHIQPNTSPDLGKDSPSVSDFLDMSIWKRQSVCCGTIFRGPYGEVVIDPRFLNPCGTCKKKGTNEKSKKSSSDEEDVLDTDGSADESISSSGSGCDARSPKSCDDDEGFFDKPASSSSPPTKMEVA
ncbi:SIN3-HDAC complex-associated factor [Lepeophtheirus salmonis]|uniref:Putative LOC100651684 [Bombus terrestris] n=1 Tax=Lepeophtheirus salmonis TaxID=72036 RepID=A0A0K2TCA0_LEPSM|nr:SIN3-HDAC complex-associated factor-like [Lepeophtheirus salmonis]